MKEDIWDNNLGIQQDGMLSFLICEEGKERRCESEQKINMDVVIEWWVFPKGEEFWF
jgi:hypothetical protein